MRENDVPTIARNLRELYGDKALVFVALEMGRAMMAGREEAIEMWHRIADTITAADERTAR